MEQVDRWQNGKRRDGCALVWGIDGWLIMPGDEGLPVAQCPCCSKPFGTAKTAQLVADFLYPMQEAGD
jgi:hypothetical protein